MSALVAFAAGLWLSINMHAAAYYLLPARAWELATGAVIAVGVVPQIRGGFLREAVPSLGIGLILFGIFWIRSDMTFPGWVALIPCLGAAMVLHSDGRSRVARHVLSSRPFVSIGLLSYSLYLWHWPVLAALRVRTAQVGLDPLIATAAVTATFVLAWVSWRYVEIPFRDRRAMPAGRMLALLGGGSVVVIGLAGLSVTMAGFPFRLSEPARIALAAKDDIDPLFVLCEGIADSKDCRFGDPHGPVTYAIIGDSHAAAIRPAVEASGLAGDTAGALYWAPNCPLLEGARPVNSAQANCTAFKKAVWERIEGDASLKTVVLAGRWPSQMTGWKPEEGGPGRSWLVDGQTVTPSAEESALVLERALERTIDRLIALGLDVVLVGSVPEPGFDVPHAVAMARHTGMAVPRVRRDLVKERAGAADSILADISQRGPGVKFVSVWESFCGETWCDIEQDGIPLYLDSDHLSNAGAVRLSASLSEEDRSP